MFDNIGGKIKTLAKVLCWIGIILSIILGIIMIIGGANVASNSSYGYSSRSSGTTGASVLVGILTMVLGSLGSWISSFFAYGFGQLIEDTEAIRRNTKSN